MVYYRTAQDELGLMLFQQIRNQVRSSLSYDQKPRKKSEPKNLTTALQGLPYEIYIGCTVCDTV